MRSVYLCAAALAIGACAGANRHPTEQTSEYPANVAVDDDSGVHIHEESYFAFTVGGADTPGNATAQSVPMTAPDGGSLAVTADSGSGEIPWLVAHIADNPGRLRSDDSDAVIQLSAHGADGVRAAVEVLRRGDAARVQFARRVVERAVERACHDLTRVHIQLVTSWFELDDAPPPPGSAYWSRPFDAVWTGDQLARVNHWVDVGMPCVRPQSSSPPPSSSPPTH